MKTQVTKEIADLDSDIKVLKKKVQRREAEHRKFAATLSQDGSSSSWEHQTNIILRELTAALFQSGKQKKEN